jgi:hypothetical protein
VCTIYIGIKKEFPIIGPLKLPLLSLLRPLRISVKERWTTSARGILQQRRIHRRGRKMHISYDGPSNEHIFDRDLQLATHVGTVPGVDIYLPPGR